MLVLPLPLPTLLPEVLVIVDDGTVVEEEDDDDDDEELERAAAAAVVVLFKLPVLELAASPCPLATTPVPGLAVVAPATVPEDERSGEAMSSSFV